MNIENIALIIVTAFINLAVSNFVFYRYQKKIENSFAEKLETFRANLQKSSTEHQVKFSRNYPKTLEVLETYHHKLQEFSQFFHQVHLSIIRAVRGTPLEDMEIQEKRHYFFRVFQDFTTYLTANRLYLPDEFVKEFEQMNDRAGILGMSSMSLFEQANDPIESIIDHINLWSKWMNISTNIQTKVEVDIPKEAFEKLTNLLDEAHPISKIQRFTQNIEAEFTTLLQRSEKLFKSLAETKQ